ncbi:MAG: hypothetical protein ABH859_07175 [Pseudomonadota bacterium]
MQKTPDGKNVRYNHADIEMLWYMGFVDTEQYPLATWKDVFEPFRQKDGTFLIGKKSFLELDKYRYKGEIHIPFDAMLINEGLYTDEGLNELIEASIEPSVMIAQADFEAFWEQLKKDFRNPKGLIKIGPDAKIRIRSLIEKHPSPLRNLEISFDQMLRSGQGADLEQKFEGAKDSMATAQAAMEASTFVQGAAHRTQASAQALKNLQKAKEKQSVDDKDSLELKRIRRSRKGMRG